MQVSRLLLGALLFTAAAALPVWTEDPGPLPGQRRGPPGSGRLRRQQERLATLPRFDLLREGQPWRAWVIEDLLPSGQVFQEGAERVEGLPLFEFLSEAGVRHARRVVVQGHGGRPQELDWPSLRSQEQRLALVLTGPRTLGLIGSIGPSKKSGIWVLDVWAIDLHGAVVGGAENPRHGEGRADDRAAPHEILIVAADGAKRPLSLEAVRRVSIGIVNWNGRDTPYTPLPAVLAEAGIPATASVRVVSDREDMVLKPGAQDLADPKDYGVVFNRRGYPVLTREDALRARSSASPRLSATAANSSPFPKELKRFNRIEVLP